VFSVLFGRYVLDSTLTNDDKDEPWYDAANVAADGYIFRPQPIIPGSLRFNCVIQTTLPLDPKIIGINPVRLPLDGRVQKIKPGDTLVIFNERAEPLPPGLAAESSAQLTRGGIASVTLYDQDGERVDPTLYTLDKAAGTITFSETANLAPYRQPLVARHIIEDMALCTDAQIGGQIAIAQPLTRNYSAGDSYVSSAMVIGDTQARVQGLFALNTWTGNWDASTGTPPTSGAQYNALAFPILVNNRDAVTQRWRLQFTGSTAFNVVSEEFGIVGTGTTTSGASPVNPANGQPYFTIAGGGFGTGWATGNALRFDTIAAGAPVWFARTTKPGPATETEDEIRAQLRWDKD
jgi:hypothetical protein